MNQYNYCQVHGINRCHGHHHVHLPHPPHRHIHRVVPMSKTEAALRVGVVVGLVVLGCCLGGPAGGAAAGVSSTKLFS